MPKIVVRGRFRKWGNTFAFAVSPKDVARLKAREGSEATAIFTTEPPKPDFSGVAVFSGGPRLSDEHDRAFGEGWERHKGKRA